MIAKYIRIALILFLPIICGCDGCDGGKAMREKWAAEAEIEQKAMDSVKGDKVVRVEKICHSERRFGEVVIHFESGKTLRVRSTSGHSAGSGIRVGK